VSRAAIRPFDPDRMDFASRLCRARWWVLGGWAAAAVGLALLAPAINPTANERTSFLPDWTSDSRAAAALRKDFPDSSGFSEAVVVFERRGGKLTGADYAAIEAAAAEFDRPGAHLTAGELAGVHVRTPASFPLPANPFKSADGQAALVVVNIPSTFITMRSFRVVEHIRHVLAAAKLPAGLSASVTGSSGFGHDYARAAERSERNSLGVTVAAVLIIPLLVYRSPLAAMVPLLAISVAVFTAMRLLAVAQHFGMHVGTAEKIFVVVLAYGAGTDYSLLLLSRVREFLDAGLSGRQAAAAGLSGTFSAIAASAGTDIVGMLMLICANYGLFHTSGQAIALSLAVTLAASLTLVPAMAAALGRRMFWPSRRMGQIGQKRLWPAVARLVVARPAAVILIVLVALAIPAAGVFRVTWVYDALAELPPAAPGGVGNAAAGLQAARRHWPVGQVAPVAVLVEAPRPLPDEKWQAASRRLTAALAAVGGVSDVRSLTQPLGHNVGLVTRLALEAAGPRIRAEYLASGGSAMRLQVILAEPALTLKAMAVVTALRAAAEKAVAASVAGGRVHVAGATAEMMDVRSVTRADFRRVAALVLGAIFVMVLLLLRDWILSAFMVAATVLGYLATLGLAAGLLALAGRGGVDWKVEIFLFVVMVAVGVDYSIFLAARVRQEARSLPPADAVRSAVIHTGPAISSCGLIMAATLGSLMAGELELLVQLGAALSLGMIIDTFIVRPLLLPAFISLTGRTGRKRNRRGSGSGGVST